MTAIECALGNAQPLFRYELLDLRQDELKLCAYMAYPVFLAGILR